MAILNSADRLPEAGDTVHRVTHGDDGRLADVWFESGTWLTVHVCPPDRKTAGEHCGECPKDTAHEPPAVQAKGKPAHKPPAVQAKGRPAHKPTVDGRLYMCLFGCYLIPFCLGYLMTGHAILGILLGAVTTLLAGGAVRRALQLCEESLESV